MARNPFNATLKRPKVGHSWQDLSHHRLSSMQIGRIHPNLAMELLPSDIITGNSLCKIRLAPMKYPVFSHINFSQHYFQVPIRLILGDKLYEQFLNTEGEPYRLPLVFACLAEHDPEAEEGAELEATKDFFRESIFDYLGYDVNPSDVYLYGESEDNSYYGISLGNGLKFFSFLLIWRNYFADEQQEKDYAVSQIDNLLLSYREYVEEQWKYGEHRPAPFGIIEEEYESIFTGSTFYCNLEKDYFTSASVEPQRGDPVYLTQEPSFDFKDPSGNPSTLYSFDQIDEGTFYGLDVEDNRTAAFINRPSLDVSTLWKLEQIQRFKNVDNFFGSRVVEKLYGHFGVVCSDARFQIPRYLGGAHQIFDIQEVIQTSESSEESALGSYAGKGALYRVTRGFRNLFIEEHSILLGICCTYPENGYSNGLDRFDLKDNCLDFAWPEFNNIGYQDIWKGELFSHGGIKSWDPDTYDADKGTFAYQTRYSDYRAQRSLQTGAFRYDPVVASWSQYKIFETSPNFSLAFIKSDPDTISRIFNVSDGSPQGFFDSFHKIGIFRAVSKTGINPMHL